MNYNYTSNGSSYDYNNGSSGTTGAGSGALGPALGSGNAQNNNNATASTTPQQPSAFPQAPSNAFQSPLNQFSNLKATTTNSSNSGYSTPLLSTMDLASSSVSSNSSSASAYSRQRFLYSKGFDLEDDLEFCPEIMPFHLGAHHAHHAKFNPYTAAAFSPISPPNSNAEMAEQNTKKTPIQDTNQTASPRIHTPRIKKPLEIINPQTGSKVGSPGIRN